MSIFHYSEPELVFIHTQKTAGKAIRNAINTRHDAQYFGHFPENLKHLFAFAVVRHPMDRFLSTVHMFKYGSTNNNGREIVTLLPDLTVAQTLDVMNDQSIGFDRTVRTPLGSLKHHLVAQTHAFTGLQHADLILRFENIEQDFEQIRKQFPAVEALNPVNTSKNDFAPLVPTQSEWDQIIAYYQDDFAQLGYALDTKLPVHTPKLIPHQDHHIWDAWPILYTNDAKTNDDVTASLPAGDVDFTQFIKEQTPIQPIKSDNKRYGDLRKKYLSLQAEFSSKSRLSFLLACAIVALRRAPQNERARKLFHRILDEHGAHVVTELSLRWLVSLCDTLVDCGQTPAQIAIGFAGSAIANTVKLYETERVVFSPPRPWPPTKQYGHGGKLFGGMQTFSYKKGDMIDNLLERAFKAAEHDTVSGMILLEIMARLQYENSAYRRISALPETLDLPVLEKTDLDDIRKFLREK
jgi:hypothetical protein